MQTDFGWMLVRLCLSGPVMYIGLAMALDPDGFVAMLGNMARELRNFEQRMREPRWQAPIREADSIAVTGRMRLAFRVAGIVLAVFAVLHLAGIIA
jgi:hypothetical protein